MTITFNCQPTVLIIGSGLICNSESHNIDTYALKMIRNNFLLLTAIVFRIDNILPYLMQITLSIGKLSHSVVYWYNLQELERHIFILIFLKCFFCQKGIQTNILTYAIIGVLLSLVRSLST